MIAWLLVVLGVSMIIPVQAHAYLDAGSGSMMMQLLLAGFAGAIVALKMFWRRLMSFLFHSKKDRTPNKK